MDSTANSSEELKRLLGRTPVRTLEPRVRLVVFSDLHLGNGGRNDDFAANSGMFMAVLQHYLESGATLVLNGDIEDLQRFRLQRIVSAWEPVYELFSAFKEEGKLHRLVGNHDLDLLALPAWRSEVAEALRFEYNGETIFIFHGHQTSQRYSRYNRLVGLGLRLFANPLSISSFSVSHDSSRRFRTEERVYAFASAHKLLSIIGHTHRPLFESMSKVDSIKFEIERLCRKYPKAGPSKQAEIERVVAGHKAELRRIDEHNDEHANVASLYSANLVVPCVFNSGTVIGKRGMTCLELEESRLSLVHWFDERRSQRYLRYANYETSRLGRTDYHRVTIKSESLDYIFARIKLLSGA